MKLMKSIIIIIHFFSILCLIPFISAQELREINIQNSALLFEDNHGSFESEYFYLLAPPYSLKINQPIVNLNKGEDNFSFQYDELKLRIDIPKEGAISSLSFLKLGFFDFKLIPNEEIKLNAKEIAIEIGDGLQQLEAITIKCKNLGSRELARSYLSACLSYGLIEIPVIHLDKESRKSVSPIFRGLKGLKGEEIKKIEQIKATIFNKQFNMSFKAKYIFRLKAKVQGEVKYDQEKKEIHLIIKKAKVGWFSVKSTLLKEIRKANLKGVKVIGERVILSL